MANVLAWRCALRRLIPLAVLFLLAGCARVTYGNMDEAVAEKYRTSMAALPGQARLYILPGNDYPVRVFVKGSDDNNKDYAASASLNSVTFVAYDVQPGEYNVLVFDSASHKITIDAHLPVGASLAIEPRFPAATLFFGSLVTKVAEMTETEMFRIVPLPEARDRIRAMKMSTGPLSSQK